MCFRENPFQQARRLEFAYVNFIPDCQVSENVYLEPYRAVTMTFPGEVEDWNLILEWPTYTIKQLKFHNPEEFGSNLVFWKYDLPARDDLAVAVMFKNASSTSCQTEKNVPPLL